MYNTNKLNEKINSLVSNSMDNNKLPQYTSIVTSINNIYSVPKFSDLPPPADNRGRFIYIDSLGKYAMSNGLLWTYNFSYSGIEYNAILVGNNSIGQLGDNTTTNRSSFVAIITNDWSWKQISCSANYHTAAIKSDDTLWTWGKNVFGELGDNTATNRSSPVLVVGGFTWKQVGCGDTVTLAIKSDDTLWAWGFNGSGELGDNTGTSKSSPVSVVGGFTWKQVSVGYSYNAAIKSDNTLWAWGYNYGGQLGDNTATTRSSPVSVVGGFTWKQVSAGKLHTAAIKSDDTIWAWGYNIMGSLGDNTNVVKSSPVSLVAPANAWTWKHVQCGFYHTAAIKSDDTLWTWGYNNAGQLGDNTTTNKSSPVSVIGGFTWKQINTGDGNTAAIKSDDTLWTWGYNADMTLGDGTTINKSSPISTLENYKWLSIDSFRYHIGGLIYKGF